MGDARRLRQAGGAGGIDIEGDIIERHRRALGRLQRAPVERGDLEIDSPGRRLGRAMRKEGQIRARGRKDRDQPRIDNRRLGLDHRDAMGERGAGQIGVDERRCDAGAREAEPDRQIFRTVGHHQGDDVAAPQAEIVSPAGIAMRPVVELPVGQRLTLAVERRPIAIRLRPDFEVVAQSPLGMIRDIAHIPDDAQQAETIGEFALYFGQHTGALPPRPRMAGIKKRFGANDKHFSADFTPAGRHGSARAGCPSARRDPGGRSAAPLRARARGLAPDSPPRRP